MKFNRSVYSLAAAVTLGAVALAMSGAAQAGDVYWSVGVASPGVRVGVASAPPVVYQPPVIVQHYPAQYPVQYPVYQAYPSHPVVVYQQPRYVAPVQWSPPGRGWGRGHERGYERGHERGGHGHAGYEQVRYEREGHRGDGGRGGNGGRGGHRD